ncbi:MAG: hypothetical protein IJZ53_04415 [Tyzzerella sp.]|nr:hypothetical protein [Tyzzerella sp.]
MENNKKINWKVIINLVMAVILVVCLVKLSNLTDEINNLQSQLSYWQSDVNNIRSDISSIYNNVDEHLKKEASLLSHVDYELGELDGFTHKAVIYLKVVPKNITEGMQLSVSIGEENAEFIKKDNEYTASLPANIFSDYGEYPMLHIQTAEGTKTELLESVDLSYLHYNYLPVLESDIWGSSTYRNDTLTIDGNVLMDCKPSSSSSNVKAVKAELVTELNGKEIDRKDITSKLVDDYCEFSFEEKYKVDDEVELAMYVEMEDSAGYIHRSSKYYWLEKNGSTGHATEAVHTLGIYDKDGNLLNEFE